MIRNVIVILLMVAFASQTFEGTFLVLDYYANTGSFARNCENKLRPDLHCNGKCILMKKLKEQENSPKNAERKSENKSQIICSPFSALSLIPDYTVSTIEFPSYKENIHDDLLSSFFHPPQAC